MTEAIKSSRRARNHQRIAQQSQLLQSKTPSLPNQYEALHHFINHADNSSKLKIKIPSIKKQTKKIGLPQIKMNLPSPVLIASKNGSTLDQQSHLRGTSNFKRHHKKQTIAITNQQSKIIGSSIADADILV